MLVESISSLLFYLVMIGSIGSIILMLFSGSKLATMEQEIGTIKFQVRQLYSATHDYTGLTASLAKTAGAIPSSLIRSDGSLKNAWGGDVDVKTGSDPQTFQIIIKNVPEGEVTKLAMFQGGSWVDVKVNTTSIVGATNQLSAAAGAVTSTNTITFVSN